MSINTRESLKSNFEKGKRATQEKFEDLIDSSFNKIEDSLLLGPAGATGKIGLWLSDSDAPIGPTANGEKGEVVVSDSFLYLCHEQNNWIKISGDSQF